MEAMRVRIRYDMPDEKGETRRERAIRFGQDDTGPSFNLPDECHYIWSWYWTISARLKRVRDGACEPIPASEFLAWCRASDTIVTAAEYGIVCAMDEVFCAEMNSELDGYRQRQEENRRQESRLKSSMPWKRK